jgi:hypothetical protein
VQNDQKSYQDAVVIDEAVPERQVSDQALAPSSIHRWISTLAALIIAHQQALKKLLQQNPAAQIGSQLEPIQIPEKKYKTHNRKHCLLRCRWFFKIQDFLKISFHRVCNKTSV